MTQTINYPIGIQNFSKLINGGYLYIDKTMYIHRLSVTGGYYFLSRPRRFGKSLLASTMEEYFRGNRDLFKGLAIDRLQPEKWIKHPVLHLDFTQRGYNSPDDLLKALNYTLDNWEKEYGEPNTDDSPDGRFNRLIRNLYERYRCKVVVLIDEYDKPIIDAADIETQTHNRKILHDFYGVMKGNDQYLKFVFLTGVGKLGQINIFSGLNNIRDISLLPEFSAICGITTDELTAGFKEGIECLGKTKNWPTERTLQELKTNYDGYHFAEDLTDVYNPFSLLNALASSKILNYWYYTGTPTRLYEELKEWRKPLGDLENVRILENSLQVGNVLSKKPIITMFYTGYLTIKSYDSSNGLYTLGYPNREVRESFVNGLMEILTGVDTEDRILWVEEMRAKINDGDIDGFLRLMQTFMAGNSYRTNPNTEIHYQNLIYFASRLINLNVDMERATSDGRMDMTINGPKGIYIIEFKLDRSPQEALRQIDEKQYALPFQHAAKPIVKIGVNISSEKRNIDSWLINEAT